MQKVAVILSLLVCAACAAAARPQPSIEQQQVTALVAKAKTRQYKNTQPTIGILTQPCTTCPGRSYIAASYVKWVEAAGGRVVPIRFYATDAELYRLFKSVNGLVFPGGLTWLWLDAPYVITARKLFNWAIEANDKGDVFPVSGHAHSPVQNSPVHIAAVPSGCQQWSLHKYPLW
eukprot:GHRR01026848.1.p1 GENE.GHRR01026848.1~~GHRR01026848.1.p1  ORF type:complete len:175 (+),score=32.54 GHRR01026848.1:153-677(+)